MSDNLKITTEQNLYKMLKDHEIVIPIIQRDYAQGRDNENVREIRENFISDIFDKLTQNKKLKLSFVYGTEEVNQYVPYDGQQRLTLVFLIMLYLSEFSEDHIDELSKFSYRTRDFSVDFCKYITNKEGIFKTNPLSEIKVDNDSLKETIKNDINFFSAWLADPTVYSMINVLQTIHVLFNKLELTEGISNKKEQAKDFIQKLKDGYIFFDWCTLNASDSIYVKMNGRGKTLSAFDNFKNTLYGVLDLLRAKNKAEIDAESDIEKKIEKQNKLRFLENFEQKMDSDWTDLFWLYRGSFFDNNPENVNIAPAMMNFIYFAFEYRLVAKSKKFFFGNGEAVRWLDENKIVSFLSIFRTFFFDETLTIDDYIWLSKLFDILSKRLNTSDELIISNSITRRILLDEKQLFISLCKQLERYDYESHITAAFFYNYLIRASKFTDDGNLESIVDTFKEDWSEFILNINQTVQFFNSHFNDLVNDKKVYYAIELISDKIFELSEEGDMVSSVSGITQSDIDTWKKNFVLHADNQLQEEYEKLILRNKDSNWTQKISEANNIEYFNGQVYFLIEASKDANQKPNIQSFDNFTKAANLLVHNNLKLIDDNIIRCILLSFGDYRINTHQSFSNTYSICQSSVSGTAKYFLWKSLFDILYSKRQDFITKLLESIVSNNYDINQTLKACKSNCTDSSWTSIIVRYPELLNYIGEFGLVDTEHALYPCIITSDGTKKLVREEHIYGFAINIKLYGIYRALGFTDNGKIPTNLSDKWTLPTRQIIQQISATTFKLSENGTVLLDNASFEDIVANARRN